MQTGQCSIEVRSQQKPDHAISLITVFRITAGAGLFCGVFVAGAFQWIFG